MKIMLVFVVTAFDVGSVTVFRNVVTEAESSALVSDCETSLRRRRYQTGHWDQVIEKYREVELRGWSADNDK
jgi:alkylated DNA repair protein alkB family protein 7